MELWNLVVLMMRISLVIVINNLLRNILCMNKNVFYYLYCCYIDSNDNDVQTFTKNIENEVTSKQFSNENVTRTKKEKNKLNFTSEISSRMERLENQKKKKMKKCMVY